MTRQPLIAGNWKMYKTVDEALAFAESFNTHVRSHSNENFPEIALCAPAIALKSLVDYVGANHAPFKIGAQNMESRDEGAYTGEISPLMLKGLCIELVIIGHSERREYYNETDASVNAKVKAALAHGLTPIICVGESLEQREADRTDMVITVQVEQALKDVQPNQIPNVVFAYEPIWAIGTGKVCESDEANRVCQLIREKVAEFGDSEAVRILYGGSMKPANAEELLHKPHIDGGLVGGASLEPASFFAICESANLVTA